MDGSILIVDDVATNRIVLRAKLSAARYRPLLAASGADGLAIAREVQPNLILLDLRLPDMSGIEMVRSLRADAATRHIPIIVLSATTSLSERLDALSAGADEVFPKPCQDSVLLARVRNLLRGRQELEELGEDPGETAFGLAESATPFVRPGILAIVTDSKERGVRLRRELQPMLRDHIVLLGSAEALGDSEARQASPDTYLIDEDSEPSGEWGRRLLSDLRSRAGTRNAALCLMLGPNRREQDAAMAFDLGANDVVSSGVGPAELAARLRAMLRRKLQADLHRETLQDELRQALLDPVTGIHNRRYGMTKLIALVQLQGEGGGPLSVIIADLDRFKSVNDRFGHTAGDHVLVHVARRLSANLRDGDVLARFGGEEFLIALPNTGLDEANIIAERLRRVLSEEAVLLPNDEAVCVTASFGLAVLSAPVTASRNEAEQIALAVIGEADAALLSAKAAGRDMVTIAQRNVA